MVINSNTYSDLYKVLWAQMCPQCKVMIVRSEGCKFMECGKCKFQFCWLCLSEFYTEYHYYESLCPFRIIPIYGTVVLSLLLFLLKLLYESDWLAFYLTWIVTQLSVQIFTFGINVLFLTFLKKFWQVQIQKREMRTFNIRRDYETARRLHSEI